MILIINSTATVTITSPDTDICTGQSAILTATGLPAGGTYQWAPLTGMNPIAGNTATVTVTPGTTQTYQVTYTSATCSGTASKTVNVSPSVVAHSGGNQTYCLPHAATITLGGSPTATGGSGSFTYAWSPSGNLSSTSTANPTIVANTAGTTKYYVTVTDNVSGCSSVDSMILTINPLVIANAGANDSICAGTSKVIGGSPTGSGGTGTLTYSWTPGTGLSATNVPNPTASPAVNTTYTVVVTDTKSCSASSSVLVVVNPIPVANAGANKSLTACSNAVVTIGGSPTGSGGTGKLTFQWSPTGGLDTATVANPKVSHLGSTTTYTVTVTDANGCTAQGSVVVNVSGSTISIDAGNGGSYCEGTGEV